MRINYWKWINVIVDFYNKILNVRKLEKKVDIINIYVQFEVFV